MKQLTRFAVAALALVLASPSIAANDVVYINGLPLFVSTINSGAVQAVAVYTPANAPLSVANLGTASFASPAPITVTTSATPLAAARTGAAGTGRVAITITCVAAVAIGPTSGVTFAGNAQIPAGAALTLNTTSAVYGIASGSSTTCNVWETF